MRLYFNTKGFNFNDPLDFHDDFTEFMYKNVTLVPSLNREKQIMMYSTFDITHRIILKI